MTTIATAPSPGDSGTTLAVLADTGLRFPTAPFPRYTALVWPLNQTPVEGVNAETVTVLDTVGDEFTIERSENPIEITAGMQFAIRDLVAVYEDGGTLMFTATFPEEASGTSTLRIVDPQGRVTTAHAVDSDDDGVYVHEQGAGASGLYWSQWTAPSGAQDLEQVLFVKFGNV